MRLGWSGVGLLTTLFLLVGCDALNLGRLTPFVRTEPAEQFYLLKDSSLTSGSLATPRESFDHNMHPAVHLNFTPKDEKNSYVAESRWYDPLGIEFRTIRTTYDKQEEGKRGFERPRGGTNRVHTMSTTELHAHKAGMWKVALYLDGNLARKLPFSVH